ncbi:MAG: hypothetical protein ABI134_14720 [Byssovorax sp.]
MSETERKLEPEHELRILETLANQQAPSSAEHAAIELAARALLFIHATKQATAFGEYLKEIDAGLTDEQRKHLDRLGLE